MKGLRILNKLAKLSNKFMGELQFLYRYQTLLFRLRGALLGPLQHAGKDRLTKTNEQCKV